MRGNGDDTQALELLWHTQSAAWAASLSIQKELYNRLVSQLSDHVWNSDFLDRVCELLGWDKDASAPAAIEPDKWERLIFVYNQQAFFERLQGLLQKEEAKDTATQAAWMLLRPLTPSLRRRLQDIMEDTAWQAYEILEQELQWRYPQLLQRFPDHRVGAWRCKLPGSCLKSIRRVSVVVLAVICIFIRWQYGELQSLPDLLYTILLAYGLALIAVYPVVILYLYWRTIFEEFCVPDVWLSQRLLPERFFRQGGGMLVLRHLLSWMAFIGLCGYGLWRLYGNQWLWEVLGITTMLAFLTFYYMDQQTSRVFPPWNACLSALRRRLSRLFKKASYD